MATLAGKTWFITGASRGIGLAIARRAARDGANIVIAAKSAVPNPKLPGTIHTAAAEIEAAGGKALALQVDIREESEVVAAAARAAEHFGGIDIVVNNASAIWLAGTADTPMKRYDLMHQVNSRGTFLVTRTCLPYLKQASNPHVLMLSPPLNLDPKWFAPHTGLIREQIDLDSAFMVVSHKSAPNLAGVKNWLATQSPPPVAGRAGWLHLPQGAFRNVNTMRGDTHSQIGFLMFQTMMMLSVMS